MRVWSRGLGRVELAADLRHVKVYHLGKTLLIVGKSEPPVSWDFVISLDSSEIWAVSRLALNRGGLRLFARYLKLLLFNRKGLSADYAVSTKTRTGIKPEQEYATVLSRSRKKE